MPCTRERRRTPAPSTRWHNDYIRAECEHGTAELDRRRLSVVTSGKDGLLTRRELPLLDRSLDVGPPGPHR